MKSQSPQPEHIALTRMPLSETLQNSRRQRLPPREEVGGGERVGGGGGGGGSSQWTPRHHHHHHHPPLPRPHTIDFSATTSPTTADLSPYSSPSHHPLLQHTSSFPFSYYTSISRNSPLTRWGSGSLGGGGGGGGGSSSYLSGADPASGGLSGGFSSREGHSRLPSTDSGIQADAGWGDSLTRSHRGSLGKASAESPGSPDNSGSRTPLKALTRSLMESRGSPSNRWGDEPTPSPTSSSSRPLSFSLRSVADHGDVRRMTSESRPRTASCDSDVRGGGELVTSPRMMSSYPGGRSGFSVHYALGRAPTTRGEDLGVRRWEEDGGSWKGGESVMSRSADSALSTSTVLSPLSTPSSLVPSPEEQRGSLVGSSGARAESGSTSASTSRSDSSDKYPSHQAQSTGHGSQQRPELIRSLSAQLSSRSDRLQGKEEEKGDQASGGRYSSSVSAPIPSSKDPKLERQLSSDNRSTPPLRLISSSSPVVPSRSTPEGGPGSPQRGMVRREVMSPERRSLSRDGSLERNRLHRFQLNYPRISSSVSTASPDRESYGSISSQDSHQTRLGGGLYSSRPPGMVPLPVTHLMSSSGGTGALGRTRHVQVLQRPLRSDLTSSRNLGTTNHHGTPSFVQISRSASHASSPSSPPSGGSENSEAASPESSRKIARVIPVQSSPPVRSSSQVSTTSEDQKIQPDPLARAQTTPSSPSWRSGSTSPLSASPFLSRSRYLPLAYRSRLSPVLSRSMSPGKVPLSHTSASSSSCPGRPIPVLHVATCRACFKTPETTPALPSSPGIPTRAGQAPGSSSDSLSQDSSGISTASTSGDLRVKVEDASPLPPEVAQKLLEGGGEEGRRGGGGEVPVVEVGTGLPWKERRRRMDAALTWLKAELEWLRAMDAALVTQFRRCQETVETLKQQQLLDLLAWGDGEGSEWGWGLDGSEMDEEEDVWEDWEIAEFERKWAENPDAREVEITLEPVTSPGTEPKTNDVSAPSVTSEEQKNPPSPIQQDVEATV